MNEKRIFSVYLCESKAAVCIFIMYFELSAKPKRSKVSRYGCVLGVKTTSFRLNENILYIQNNNTNICLPNSQKKRNGGKSGRVSA